MKSSQAMATMVEVRVEGREPESAKWEATCWGCKLQLMLPQISPVFKCGYCGAVNTHKPTAKPPSCWSRRLSATLDHFLVTFVVALVLCIVYGGVWTMFPVLFPSASFGLFLHSAITAFLAFNTLFNFAFAASIPAGPPPLVEWGRYEVVSRGGLDNVKFCAHCQKPKPPRARHCRTCRACVLDMDHHCPFIGNCVGASNHGYFLLFLIFTTASVLYVLMMALYTYSQARTSLMVIQYDPLPDLDTTSMGLQLVASVLSAALFDNQVVFSIRYIGLLYLFVTSLALLIGVGLLLYQQLALVYSGQTYLDSITMSDAKCKSSGKKGWTNLQRVFGKTHPLLWLLPSVNSKKCHAR